MRSSSEILAARYASSLVAVRRAGKVATNTAASCTAGGLACTLMKLRSLSESLCYLTDGDFAMGDRKGIVRPD